MPRKKNKKSRKPVKFKTITIKVTARQKKSLVNFCKLKHTTPNKIVKKAIRPWIQDYADLELGGNTPARVKQLELF